MMKSKYLDWFEKAEGLSSGVIYKIRYLENQNLEHAF